MFNRPTNPAVCVSNGCVTHSRHCHIQSVSGGCGLAASSGWKVKVCVKMVFSVCGPVSMKNTGRKTTDTWCRLLTCRFIPNHHSLFLVLLFCSLLSWTSLRRRLFILGWTPAHTPLQSERRTTTCSKNTGLLWTCVFCQSCFRVFFNFSNSEFS